MPRKRYSVEQIIHKLRETEVLLSQDRTVAEACRSLGVAEHDKGRCKSSLPAPR